MNQIPHNYLPAQYESLNELPINHNYLREQFQDSEIIINEIRNLLKRGDFTLGKSVDDLEGEFKKITDTKHAVGVGSGTDALFLSLKALDIGEGDEVITTPYTFYSTIGAIVTAGGFPRFVDVNEDYNIDPNKISSAITKKTKAIIPVHWSGLICDMESISSIARTHGLSIVEDACHAINARRLGKAAGAFSSTACFSMHPLKNLNVWGDGGMIVTNDDKIHDKLCLLRNHGLLNRDVCELFAYNSRLDTLQAIVGKHYIRKIDTISKARIDNALYFDTELSTVPQIFVPARDKDTKQVFHIYVVRAKKRDELQQFLINNGIDAKIHYPIPMHLQPAAKEFGYIEGDFPIAEKICKEVISLPVHEFISKQQREYVVRKIKKFYS
ncbi:MAG: DegT/DnrJ/EryC1/StrS family aminotransferase [Pseudomonadota bacterium]|nr:DegT/DnrJ/EryC1/StrS family aminotransferase [Pseudomonadota bacterium]